MALTKPYLEDIDSNFDKDKISEVLVYEDNQFITENRIVENTSRLTNVTFDSQNGILTLFFDNGETITAKGLPTPYNMPEPPEGDQGPIGIAGLDGRDGRDGEKGDGGCDGITGPEGNRGEKGEVGDVGPRGERGQKGKDGDSGLMGYRGERGAIGPKGESGDDGRDGNPGWVNIFIQSRDPGGVAGPFSLWVNPVCDPIPIEAPQIIQLPSTSPLIDDWWNNLPNINCPENHYLVPKAGGGYECKPIPFANTFVGFGSGTGAESSRHEIHSFEFRNSYAAVNITKFKAEDFTLLGSAHVSEGVMVLTQDTQGQAGNAWITQPIRFIQDTMDVGPFTAKLKMKFKTSNAYSHADGISFIIQSESVSAGGGGGGIGYHGIPCSVAVVFDTYWNDPSQTHFRMFKKEDDGNHVEICVNGNIYEPLIANPIPFELVAVLPNEYFVYAWVEYSSGILKVYVALNDTKPPAPVVQYPMNLKDYIGCGADTDILTTTTTTQQSTSNCTGFLFYYFITSTTCDYTVGSWVGNASSWNCDYSLGGWIVPSTEQPPQTYTSYGFPGIVQYTDFEQALKTFLLQDTGISFTSAQIQHVYNKYTATIPNGGLGRLPEYGGLRFWLYELYSGRGTGGITLANFDARFKAQEEWISYDAAGYVTLTEVSTPSCLIAPTEIGTFSANNNQASLYSDLPVYQIEPELYNTLVTIRPTVSIPTTQIPTVQPTLIQITNAPTLPVTPAPITTTSTFSPYYTSTIAPTVVTTTTSTTSSTTTTTKAPISSSNFLTLFKAYSQIFIGKSVPNTYYIGKDLYVKVAGRTTQGTYVPTNNPDISFILFSGDIARTLGISTQVRESYLTPTGELTPELANHIAYNRIPELHYDMAQVATSYPDIERMYRIRLHDTAYTTRPVNNFASMNQDQLNIIKALVRSWLYNAYKAVEAYYGLRVPPNDSLNTLRIVLQTTPQPYVSMVSSLGYGTGPAFEQELHIDATEFLPADDPNNPSGGSGWLYDDRVIAHEMVHVVTNTLTNVRSLPTWFEEGLAELIHGGDERLKYNLTKYTPEQIVNTIAYGGWTGTSVSYSAAYVALRMIHDNIKMTGGSGIIDLTKQLDISDWYKTPEKSLFNGLATLDDAFRSVSSNVFYSTASGFLNYFATFATSVINNWISSGVLNNLDVGSIGGYDADGGAVKTATTVIEDTINEIPMVHSEYSDENSFPFTVVWPTAEKIADLNILAVYRDRSAFKSVYSTSLLCYDVFRNPDF